MIDFMHSWLRFIGNQEDESPVDDSLKAGCQDIQSGGRNGEIVHLRPSGNAPELRCYAEADSEARARELVRWALGRV